jgi:acetyltransferase
VQLNATSSRDSPRAGRLALVSQSGALGSALVDWAASHNLGFSSVATLGTCGDVGVGEVLDHLALDAQTRAILLYIERVDHARRFMSGLRAAARVKPVIVVKAGRYGGAERPGCHGNVADDALFDAAVHRAGAVRVGRLEELISTAQLLSHGPRPRGERLAVVTNAGSLGVLAVDRALGLGLALAPLTAATREHCAALGADTTRPNPLELSADASVEQYLQVVERCIADSTVDAALVLLAPQSPTQPLQVAEALVASASRSSKPLLACFMGGPQVKPARALLDAHNLPSFYSPEAAVEAFGYLVRHRRNQALATQPAAPPARDPDVDAARMIIEAALSRGQGVLSVLESKAVLRTFGVPVNAAVRAQSADEALVAAESLGLPVTMQAESLDLSGSTLAACAPRALIASSREVHRAFRALTQAEAEPPSPRAEGVIVEAVSPGPEGRELSIRVTRDPALGPALALRAAGGVVGTGCAERSVGLPPLNVAVAAAMLIDSHACQPDDSTSVEHAALLQVLLCVSNLVCELPEVETLQIEPLIARPDGVIARDARIHVKRVPSSARPYEHLAMAPYPRRLVQELLLPDGSELLVRPIRSEDVALEDAFVSNLSLESRVFRFMHALSRLTPELMMRFTQLDYDRDLALLALRADGPREEVLGIARYSADSDARGCEFAVAVADAWQKRGVGTVLMGALIQAAREQHLRSMHGDVLADNRKMLAWIARLGFTVHAHPDDATIKRAVLTL